MEVKLGREDFATSLRKDINFSEKLCVAMSSIISMKENNCIITDKKLLSQLVRVLYSLLTKGKFDNQQIDITKNQEILKLSMAVFSLISKQEEDQQVLNDIIKVIGLFAKFYCYYNTGTDLTFCATFLQSVPTIINSTNKPSNIHINVIKAVGIMITLANMFPKKSLMFYRTFHDYALVTLLVNLVKTYKNVPNYYTLVKSAIECIAIFCNPMNGEVFSFPIQRIGDGEKEINYLEYKTTFEHIFKINQNFCLLFNDYNIGEAFSVLFECDMDGTLKGAILRVSFNN
jgi:hypothetical protein